MKHDLEMELFKRMGPVFEAFINEDENEKIVFSGKYGTGKTTFLNTFFNHPSEIGLALNTYDVFRLSPVNYSVASNDDIIEFIKYDIVTEFLLKPNVKVSTIEFPSYWLGNEKDIEKIFELLLSTISVKGIGVSAVYGRLKELKNSLDRKKESLDEGDQFDKFLRNIENKKGIFERDIITKLIEAVLERLTADGKQPVLIIDDFDRLDPEHIFRILNVFAAHFDNETLHRRGQRNKFGFAKVIVVCDHHNIESLFHTRYGQAADFSGYIDKFYNRTIFDFDIKGEIKDYVQRLLLQMDAAIIKQYHRGLERFGYNEDDFFEQTIVHAIFIGELSLRGMLNIRGVHLENHYQKLDYAIRSRMRRPDHTLLMVYLNLFLFGSSSKVVHVVEKLLTRRISLKIDNYTINLIMQVEALFHPEHVANKVMIQTDVASYSYDKAPSGEWKEVSTSDHPRKPFPTDREKTLDLIQHFFKRIDALSRKKHF